MAKECIYGGNSLVVSIPDLREYVGPGIVNQLLVAASQGEIDVLLELPIGCELVLLPNRIAFDYKGGYYGVLGLGSSPEYLVLLPEHCDQLTRTKSINLRDAKSGYCKEHNFLTKEVTGLHKILPEDAAINPVFPVQIQCMSGTAASELPPGMKWENWAFKPHHSPEWYRVNLDDLFVILADFGRWMGWDGDPEVNPEFFLGRSESKSDEDINDDFKSPKLLRMCEASIKLWGNKRVKSHDPYTHPSNQIVIDWLMASGAGFTKTSAENAAALIKPEFALKAGAPIKAK